MEKVFKLTNSICNKIIEVLKQVYKNINYEWNNDPHTIQMRNKANNVICLEERVNFKEALRICTFESDFKRKGKALYIKNYRICSLNYIIAIQIFICMVVLVLFAQTDIGHNSFSCILSNKEILIKSTSLEGNYFFLSSLIKIISTFHNYIIHMIIIICQILFDLY